MITSGMRTLCLLALLVACKGEDPAKKTKPPGSDSATPGLDVSERLEAGQVRAGVIASEDALLGGVSAEGQPGDLKIYNHKVAFLVQGMREGHYYESTGGGVIDADIVRPEGQPGRDILDEYMVMVGLGRLLAPDEIEVVADGSDGEAAVIRVKGHGTPMTLITGALESPGFVPPREIEITTEYRLEPDSHLLEISTEVHWLDAATETVQPGDIAMVAMDVAETIRPGRGLDNDGEATGEWMGLLGRRNEVALAVLSDGDGFADSAIQQLLSEVGPVMAPLTEPVSLSEGTTVSWTRYLGLGPDMATITGEWRQKMGLPVETVAGTVTAGGEPVAGARVHLLHEGAVETVAFTDASGRFAAEVGGPGRKAIATGRGHGLALDFPAGAAWYGAYAGQQMQEQALSSLSEGALSIPFAEGFGISAEVEAGAETALELTPPGVLSVTVSDGGPALVRVDFAEGDPVSAPRSIAPSRSGNALMWGYIRDGQLDIPVEPGNYIVTVHRGMRFEAHVEAVSIESGGGISITADLAEVVRPEGVLAADPHSHSAPSGDGQLPMEERILAHAANGVQLHFGTDHDHVADYRPLIPALGLQAHMASVVADEVSPVLKGHINIYPLEQIPDRPNAGAPRWWSNELATADTETLVAELRSRVGDGIIQLNHPAGSSGVLGNAGYDARTGTVGNPERWAEGFDAMEVLNDGSYDEYLPLYFDLVSRGHPVVPVGVSDSHGHRSGTGENLSFLDIGTDDPSAYTDEALKAAMKAGRVVVSRGPYIEATVDGEWAPGQTFSGRPTLDVVVLAPAWMDIDAVDLLENGEVVATVPAGEPFSGERLRTSFALEPDEDAFYVVIARGDAGMAPVYPGRTPWAMTAAIKVDLSGDGWTPPAEPLQIGD